MKKNLLLPLGIRRIAKNPIFRGKVWDAVKRIAVDLKEKADSPEAPAVNLDTASRILEGKTSIPEGSLEEAIILRYGRPVLEIVNDRINLDEPDVDAWRPLLLPYQAEITAPIRSVGRIELQGHPSFQWVGTGWVVAENIIITNRHVAEVFARKKENTFSFMRDFLGREYQASIDFREEHGENEAAEFAITNVLHIEPRPGPDMALLQIKWQNTSQARQPIVLADRIEPDQTVAVIGYPARDSRTSIPDDQMRIFEGMFDIKRFSPGEIDEVDHDRGFLCHDCTTLCGCSGGVVIDIETRQAMGLHFSGKEQIGNYAVTAKLIGELLHRTARPAPVIGTVTPEPIETLEEERVQISDMQGRNGYRHDFLNVEIPLPTLSPGLLSEVAPVADRSDGVLTYTNYSVIMNRERRQAIVAAVNIDGNSWRNVPRGKDKWFLDPRISELHQIGNELYRQNDLDRGHLVRRIDPAWGNSAAEAKHAAEDTFFYTNCSPQHKNLNQKIWLGLEEYILDNTDQEDLKVSVFNGPVFSNEDMIYRGVRIPKSYWKVVAANKPDGDGVYATGYLLSQGEWLDDIEFVFGEYRTFQVPLSTIETLTGLSFGTLGASDPLQTTDEAVTVVREVHAFQHIVLPQSG